jgi:uncharacterized protein (UPF0248 family)
MFPKSTEFNKRIPKTKFYEHIELGRKIKDSFVQDIDSIIWANKIAPSTVNISAGEKVTEIQVFRIILKQSDFNKDVLKTIDEQIPYHILFIVCYRDKEQAWIGYKEQSGSESRAFKVDSYYHTAWQKPEELKLAIEGLNMDAVYESFVKQISDSTAPIQWDDNLSAKENTAKIEERKKLQKQIEKLERQLRKETQPRKKFELYQKIKELKNKRE